MPLVYALVSIALAGDPARGEVLARVGGCTHCHTVEGGPLMAGGEPIVTEFGTFYGPNLTSDPVYGIGGWTEADFADAMRRGRSPEGYAYYPSFPFPSYTNVSDADLADLWAWFQAIPAVAQPSKEHELRAMYRGRWSLAFWKLLAFERGPFEEDEEQTAEWNRGAYLVRGLGHCGECHTPRTAIGATRDRREMAGHDEPPEPSPDLTPRSLDWSLGEIVSFLTDGMTPEGDVVGGVMRDVVDGTAALPEADRRAIAVYLQSLDVHE